MDEDQLEFWKNAFGVLASLYGADVAKRLIRRHWKKVAGTAFIAGLVSAPFHGVATEPDNIYPEPTLYAVAQRGRQAPGHPSSGRRQGPAFASVIGSGRAPNQRRIAGIDCQRPVSQSGSRVSLLAGPSHATAAEAEFARPALDPADPR